jgi:hypothetical protein
MNKHFARYASVPCLREWRDSEAGESDTLGEPSQIPRRSRRPFYQGGQGLHAAQSAAIEPDYLSTFRFCVYTLHIPHSTFHF